MARKERPIVDWRTWCSLCQGMFKDFNSYQWHLRLCHPHVKARSFTLHRTEMNNYFDDQERHLIKALWRCLWWRLREGCVSLQNKRQDNITILWWWTRQQIVSEGDAFAGMIWMTASRMWRLGTVVSATWCKGSIQWNFHLTIAMRWHWNLLMIRTWTNMECMKIWYGYCILHSRIHSAMTVHFHLCNDFEHSYVTVPISALTHPLCIVPDYGSAFQELVLQ